MKPGMTIVPEQSTTSASPAAMWARPSRSLSVDQNIAFSPLTRGSS
jgi:hypothetical protein